MPPGNTAGELLASLCSRYGKPFWDRVVSQSGRLHHTILIFLNGENIQEKGELAATMESNAAVEIVMLPMFEGG